MLDNGGTLWREAFSPDGVFKVYQTVFRNNKTSAIRTLYSIAASDVTGSNVRKITLDCALDPRQVNAREFANWRVCTAADNWIVPLLTSLLELRSHALVLNFNLEEDEFLEDPEINFMIEAVCTG